MKRLLASLSTLPLLLFVAAPVYAGAAASAEMCSGRPGFDALCKIKLQNGGNMVGAFVSFFIIIAILASLVFMVIGGMKWASSGGDQQKVAQARNTIIAALVGLVIAILVFFIVGVVLGFFGLGFDKLAVPKLVPGK